MTHTEMKIATESAVDSFADGYFTDLTEQKLQELLTKIYDTVSPNLPPPPPPNA